LGFFLFVFGVLVDEARDKLELRLEEEAEVFDNEFRGVVVSFVEGGVVLVVLSLALFIVEFIFVLPISISVLSLVVIIPKEVVVFL